MLNFIAVVNVIKADKTRSNMRYSLVKSINMLLWIKKCIFLILQRNQPVGGSFG